MLNRVKSLRVKRKGKKGFTLVELVIVIAVLAIIAAIAIPTVKNVIGNANTSHDDSQRQAVELACKTTWSEIESGQLTSPTEDDAKVADALKENGMVDDKGDGTLPKLKTGKKEYYYTAAGKITLNGTKELKETTPLKDVMSGDTTTSS